MIKIRALHASGHGHNCEFTPKGSMSKLIKSLTGSEIKKLSGLDNAKVLKGQDNFKRTRDLATAFVCNEHEQKAIINSVDKAEVFYQTIYSIFHPILQLSFVWFQQKKRGTVL